ncbi:hypothetical protein [Reyranella sp.]|uniref:hypothetical protein n=1 Tax=Reyranella sp. TaxID=1929291 RepID=UPI003784EF91
MILNICACIRQHQRLEPPGRGVPLRATDPQEGDGKQGRLTEAGTDLESGSPVEAARAAVYITDARRILPGWASRTASDPTVAAVLIVSSLIS